MKVQFALKNKNKKQLNGLQRFLRFLSAPAPVSIGTDRNVPAQNGTGPIVTGTDRHKIARDEFY